MFNWLRHVSVARTSTICFSFDSYLTANTIDARRLLLPQRFRDREYDKPVNVVFWALLPTTMLLDFGKK
jgi:hypothetical protein